MLQKSLILGFLVFSLCIGATVQAQKRNTKMKVATYNIRYDNKSDTANAWIDRLPIIAGMVQFHDFDIFGTQEVLHNQLQDMAKALPLYGHIGVGRTNGKQEGEFAAVFYKSDKYELLKQGHFWLSQTPDEPSKGWDAALPRICTWGQFREKETGMAFYLFNVHFDHRGEQARTESTRLVLRKIKEIAANRPVILTGDFNFSQKHKNFSLLSSAGFMKEAYHAAKIRYAPNGTFNAFDSNSKTDERIDHILVSPEFEVLRYGILTDTYGGGKFPSDHFPVLLELQYAAPK